MDSVGYISDVVKRCEKCSGALAAVVWESHDDGVVMARRRSIPHTDLDCRRFAAISNEAWPIAAIESLARKARAVEEEKRAEEAAVARRALS